MFDDINLLGILVAAIAGFVLGWVWYSKLLFGPAWLASVPGAAVTQFSRIKYLVTFLLGLFSALIFSVFLGTDTPLGVATLAGLLTGLGWVAASYGVNYMYEDRGWKLFLIDAGFHTVKFTLYGVILGLWH